jgi:hypothetical protein
MKYLCAEFDMTPREVAEELARQMAEEVVENKELHTSILKRKGGKAAWAVATMSDETGLPESDIFEQLVAGSDKRQDKLFGIAEEQLREFDRFISGEEERTYAHADVMQALAAALMFHEDIALAARDEQGGQLHPGAGNTVLMSDQAADLLREAWKTVEEHGHGNDLAEDWGDGCTGYDLRKAF